MASETISSLPTAGGIDGAADFLPIDTASPNATNKISRNILLGVTGQPADISSVQTLTNKVIGNTNTVTLKDTLFTLQDDGDTTKQAKFQLSGITTATTRTYTLPNVTDTLVSLTASQTLTNKTLTAPAITGGTIDNTTITVDSIAGHTSSTIVTVANMQISNGVINSAGAVTATSIAAGAVQPQALVSGTGTGWTLQSWTPSWTSSGTLPALNNGTLTGKYIQVGKIVFFTLELTAGTTTTFGTANYRFSLPVTPTANPSNALTWIGEGVFIRTGTAFVPVKLMLDAGTTSYAELWYSSAAGTMTNVTNTAPQTWASTDALSVRGWYQVT